MSLNQVVLIGRLTKEAELRYTPAGVAVAQFTLAVDRPFTNQGGEREADFIPVVVWKTVAENVANYLNKGSQVAVTGRIQIRNYENNEGRRVYVTEVIGQNVQFLTPNQNGNSSGQQSSGGKSSGGSTNRNGQSNRQNGSNQGTNSGGNAWGINDADLPF
ncbi:single-stranded DNA-binding protein [Paenibacillus sonchi]|uniref:Single-stranded DNA-binding protein n=1 Tax=Paenibacillus sonchi TaxID=373687 RepID=A0A974SAM1_9BACL|nr:single-stranded DNA-binding protein [Paenibacillus sonchi]QQZ58932.1 single-stranded DNA-binding protein [Paenibacillus sonchi]